MEVYEASESDADSLLAFLPAVQALQQHLRTETLQVSDEDWARRHQKRLEVVTSIKATSAYEAMAFLRSQGAAAPSTPDAYDRQISKRKWEAAAMRWRSELRGPPLCFRAWCYYVFVQKRTLGQSGDESDHE